MKFLNKAHGMLVPNVKKAIPFYRDVLGYQILNQAEGFVTFDAEGSRLFMWEWSHLVLNIGSEKMKKVKHKCLFAIYFESSHEVDEAYQYLVNKGVDFVIAPQDWDWKARAGYFVDPNGFMWEIWTWMN